MLNEDTTVRKPETVLALIENIVKNADIKKIQFSSVQSLSHVRLFATPWWPTCPSPTPGVHSNSWPSSHFILGRPLLLRPIPPSIRVFSNESTLCMRWPKFWSFSFSTIPSKEHPGLISFRMYWLDLLAVQGTLKSLFQYHNSKASILRHTAFFTVNSHIHTWPQEKP